MEKRGSNSLAIFIFIFIFVNLICTIDGTFSDVINDIDPSAIFFIVVFIIAFALMNFALAKFFKNDKKIAVVISAVIALFIAYSISRMNTDFDDSFSSIKNWFQDISMGTIIFIILGILIAIWIVKEEMK